MIEWVSGDGFLSMGTRTTPQNSQWLVLTIPLNYNFIFTFVDMRGAMQYFTCQMPKFPMEIQISTGQDVALPRDETWNLRETWHVAFTHDRIVTCTCDVVVLTKLNNQQDSSCLYQPEADYMQQELIQNPLNNI